MKKLVFGIIGGVILVVSVFMFMFILSNSGSNDVNPGLPSGILAGGGGDLGDIVPVGGGGMIGGVAGPELGEGLPK